jgi:hypothetical protein
VWNAHQRKRWGRRLEAGDAPDLRAAHRTNEEVVELLSPRTERDFRHLVERWTRLLETSESRND